MTFKNIQPFYFLKIFTFAFIPESKRRKNQDAFDFTSRADDNTIVLSPKPQDENETTDVEKTAVDDSRMENFQNQLSVIFDSERAQQMTTDIIVQGMEPHGFDNGEVLWALDKMMEDNKVFIADDIVFLV